MFCHLMTKESQLSLQNYLLQLSQVPFCPKHPDLLYVKWEIHTLYRRFLTKLTSSIQCLSKHTEGRTVKHPLSCQIQTMSCVLPTCCPLLVRCDAHAPVFSLLTRGTLYKTCQPTLTGFYIKQCSGFKVFRYHRKTRLFTTWKRHSTSPSLTLGDLQLFSSNVWLFQEQYYQFREATTKMH